MAGGGNVRSVCIYIYYIDMYNIDGGRGNCAKYNVDGGRRNCEKCVYIYII